MTDAEIAAQRATTTPFCDRALAEARIALGRGGRYVRSGVSISQGPVSVTCRMLDEDAWVEVRLLTPKDDDAQSVIIGECSLHEQPTAEAWARAIATAQTQARVALERAVAGLSRLIAVSQRTNP